MLPQLLKGEKGNLEKPAIEQDVNTQSIPFSIIFPNTCIYKQVMENNILALDNKL